MKTLSRITSVERKGLATVHAHALHFGGFSLSHDDANETTALTGLYMLVT